MATSASAPVEELEVEPDKEAEGARALASSIPVVTVMEPLRLHQQTRS